MAEINSKGALFEHCIKKGIKPPEFDSTTLPGQIPSFKAKVTVDNKSFESGTFRKKKDAEQDAAKIALQYLENEKGSHKDSQLDLKDDDSMSFKNSLQEFCVHHRELLKNELPVYKTEKVGGQDHLPSFKSTVTIGDIVCTGKIEFSNKAKSEQHVAQLALDELTSKYQSSNDPSSMNKNRLQMYCQSRSKPLPIYTTKSTGTPPVFECTIQVEDKKFNSEGRHFTKKSAEQSAAGIAMNSLKGIPQTSIKQAEDLKDALQDKNQSYELLSKVPDTSKSKSEIGTQNLHSNSSDKTEVLSPAQSSKVNLPNDFVKLNLENEEEANVDTVLQSMGNNKD